MTVADTKHTILSQCRQNGAQITPLREQVLDIVLQLEGVIKAYTVLAQMQRVSNHAVAPPTAYRALDFWAEQGILHKIPAVNGYILCSHAHHHCGHDCAAGHDSSFILVCTECGAVDEQSLAQEWKALHNGAAASGFRLKEEHVVLTGICQKCQ
ncbi:transcriptional repressor [Conchiformibius steedae DSM 2580]|uniref:Transcriptional repressor n=2 Tax=Conchiformibius steedae TaxID=153493 RepID=A0A3P2A270_9NEIS|nr:Fur family transcriptional regulator [Conchiformibius steedae]QMT34002.1 transcriptional repressor [Conchiformibius steedae]RRD89534.1 transcriptional repressor [Conchiformibius steedae]URD66773.1 transcriptional repressor [Conchiformibius steedae DSM 2580]